MQRVLGGLQSGHQSLHRAGRGPGAVEARQRDGQALDRVAAGLEDDDGPFGAADEFAPLDGGDQPCPGQRRLAAARGAEDRQEAVLLAPGRGPQLDDQPLGQRLAAEEERGVRDVEDLQAAVGTRALEGRAAGTGAGLDPPDAADQPAERLLVIERAAELDPGRRGQECRQPARLGPLGGWQEHGDDAERFLAVGRRRSAFDHAAIDGPPHLLVLPGAEAAGADEHGAGGAVGQRGLDGRLPGVAGDQVPLVKPGLDPLAHQLLR